MVRSKRRASHYGTPKEVAEALEISTQLLYRLRQRPGAGPPFRRRGGRIQYAWSDVDVWDRATTFS